MDELNTLTVMRLLHVDEVKGFVEKLIAYLNHNNIKLPSCVSLDYTRDKILNARYDDLILDTPHFYNEELGYDIRVYVNSDSGVSLDLLDYRWITVNILFETYQLAKDEHNKDYMMSDFEYSNKIKILIKDFSESLYLEFPQSFVSFSDEYNDTEVYEFVAGSSNYGKPDVELIITPKNRIGDQFETKGIIIDKQTYRVLIRDDFR